MPDTSCAAAARYLTTIYDLVCPIARCGLQVLGLEIREVRVVAREDIRKAERQQMHASRNSRTQVSALA